MEDEEKFTTLPWGFQLERAMYAVAFVAGSAALAHTARKFRRQCMEDHDRAVSLLPYKASLTVADVIILFVYAPTQFAWITTFWWRGGEVLCKSYKFIATFAFNLTGNMQVLVALDRLQASTQLNQPQAKRGREWVTRLVVAWSLAVAFALPQLGVFRVVDWVEGQPQCVSIWTVSKYAYELKRIDAFHAERISLRINQGMIPLDIVNKTVKEVERDREWMEFMEKVYNCVHLSTMVFIPYTLELILYALLLSVFAHAQKGEFDSLGSLLHKRIIEFRKALSRRKTSTTLLKAVPVLATEIELASILPSESLPSSSEQGRRSEGRESHSANGSPTTSSHLFEKGRPYRGRIMSEDFSGRYTAHSHTTRRIREIAAQLVEEGRRRASEPALHPLTDETRPVSPWLRRVSTARKATRARTFLMLSLNLLFWLPYCIHAIASSFSLIDNFHQYQFVCALVTFNAISNILL